MSADHDLVSALDPFIEQGLVREVFFEIKSGKEATVFCCRGNAAHALVAAKIYRPLEERRFRNDAMYHTGRVHLAREGRVKRAADAKSDFGKRVQYATWIDHEWQMMSRLWDAGMPIPQPLARAERAILMQYFGDDQAAAPKLHDAALDPTAARSTVERLLHAIETMLHMHVVHGDLSPYNILWWNNEPIIIDFPQAVDPRLNPAAFMLLARDIENTCRWAARHGVHHDHHRITHHLWQGFVEGEIG